MARRDLSAFFDAGLDYVGIPSTKHPEGKTYRVPCVDAKTGLWLTSLTDIGVKAAIGIEIADKEAASLKLDDDQEKTLYERILGPVWQEMLKDGVSYDLVLRIARDAYLNFTIGQEAANDALKTATLEAAGEPVAPQAGATQQPTQRKPRTPRKPAGSSSKKGSTGTRARTHARASTPSSTSPSASVDEAAAVVV